MKTRAYIESSGVGSRWEFDKNVIFGELDHIARICRDIAKVASTFISFEEIFNNNLRSITTHPEEVNNMLKKVIYIFQPYFIRSTNFLSPFLLFLIKREKFYTKKLQVKLHFFSI